MAQTSWWFLFLYRIIEDTRWEQERYGPGHSRGRGGESQVLCTDRGRSFISYRLFQNEQRVGFKPFYLCHWAQVWKQLRALIRLWKNLVNILQIECIVNLNRFPCVEGRFCCSAVKGTYFPTGDLTEIKCHLTVLTILFCTIVWPLGMMTQPSVWRWFLGKALDCELMKSMK